MHQEITDYIQIFTPNEIPSFLEEYANAPEMLRLREVGLFCGSDYSKLYNHRYFYSRYDHSLAVALIVWCFTGDKAQALAGLFHDIATPVFSHSVDFMNGDALNQSSTEEMTHTIIKESAYIRKRLDRDGLRLCDVVDYHVYPLADNDSPKLSADRLEYTLSTMLVWQGRWTLTDVAEIFHDLTVYKNDLGRFEMGFSTLDIAERFVNGACMNGTAYQKNDNKLSLNLLGDILKLALSHNILTEAELYSLTEGQVIERLQDSLVIRIRDAWHHYSQLHTVYGSDTKPEGKYSIGIETKRRYIDPLVQHNGIIQRASEASAFAKKEIDRLLTYKDKPFAYVEFAL